MKIALDYDLTYSLDPDFWIDFARNAAQRGHDVRIVTARDDRYDRTAPLVLAEAFLPVIYCRGVAKKWHCQHFVPDFIPDVWIDDKPQSILENSATSPEFLVQWRVDRAEGPVIA